MIRNEKGNLMGFHYTNSKAYEQMKTPGLEGYFAPEWDSFSGLIPLKRFANLGISGLPEQAYEPIFESLLEETPDYWINNQDYPGLWWQYLMGDICRDKEIVLLEFEILSSDEAYVSERGYIEDQLYKKSKAKGKVTPQDIREAYRNSFDTRIKANEYNGGFKLPQLTIFSGIPIERINLVWKEDTYNYWKKVLEEKVA